MIVDCIEILRTVVDEDRRGVSFNIVGVEVVDGQVVGDHRGRVVAYRDDGDRGAVGGLKVVADVELISRDPRSCRGIQ